MTTKFSVPTLKDQQSADDLKGLILESESDAKVNIDLATKTVTVESQASEETFNELISAAGHSIDKVEEQ